MVGTAKQESGPPRSRASRLLQMTGMTVAQGVGTAEQDAFQPKRQFRACFNQPRRRQMDLGKVFEIMVHSVFKSLMRYRGQIISTS
jgi:hypothetical protein